MIASREDLQIFRNKRILTEYTEIHSGTLLVVGSAPDWEDDINNARTLRGNCDVMAIGHASGFTHAKFLVSDHYEIHETMRKLQTELGNTDFTTHCALCSGPWHYAGAVDYWWNFRRSEATSAQTAIRIGLYIGYDEIILCGCPLTKAAIQHPLQVEKDGRQWPPSNPTAGKGHAAVLDDFQRFFKKFATEFEWFGYVYSMSGYTKDLLGEPPQEKPADKDLYNIELIYKVPVGTNNKTQYSLERKPQAVVVLRRENNGRSGKRTLVWAERGRKRISHIHGALARP